MTEGPHRPAPLPVSLVGAGPGDPELLTVRAARLLAAADAVFHDELVSPAVLALARPEAELVAVGHRAGRRRRPVAEVVAAMARAARAGRRVVRLKGGDPYLFGRGAEEAEELLRLGLAFEVVPGISSALAGPAAAGIPLTHRELASSVTIVTGHAAEGEGRVRWDRLATASDTLVVLMGAGRLAALAEDLVAAGRDPATPAAVVMAATTPGQRQVVAPLAAIAEAAAAAGLEPPALLVVGPVVRLATVLGAPSAT
ncbi:MAG TPA: uroporphyrinogen-III C-methyltransferase [Candidatus Dormibacteraeota bacterium]|jgi:uroporphyrin-III C-methyltransferase|nr:uroporphyrinogen-III C-methyltransferase [Candidatus Dormibacteraeota bacterium]